MNREDRPTDALRRGRLLLFGRPLNGLARHRPFFIVGSGRCGSTLLRASLQAHPELHIPPETYVLGKVIREYRRYSRATWSFVLQHVLSTFEYNWHFDAFEMSLRPLYHELLDVPVDDANLAFVIHSFYMYHARLAKPSACRWGDKTPLNTFHLNAIRRVFPDCRIIHLIRDGRDVVQSYVRLGRYGIRDAATRWTRAVDAAREFGARHPEQYLEVRYEALVHDPAAVLERVCDFVGIGFVDGMLRHHKLDLRLGDVDRMAHHANVRGAISTDHMGQWRDFFGSEQRKELDAALGDALGRAGYATSLDV